MMNDDKIDISGLDKAEVLAALYNAARPIEGFFTTEDTEDMTRDAAQALIDEERVYFGYLKGRVMKVDISTNSLYPWLFDRYNGQGAAKDALSPLLSSVDKLKVRSPA